MNNEIRRKVLSCFKQLHRARLEAFQGDEAALTAARMKINDEFAKNKGVSNSDAVEGLLVYGQQVEEVLRKHVVQAKKIEDNTYRATIRKDTTLIETANYQEMPEEMIGPFKRRKKCGDPETKGN